MTDDVIADELRSQTKTRTPATAIEAMAVQLRLLRDCDRRVQEEGAIIVDGKGNATPHPAIAIGRAAGAELQRWLKQYG